MRNYRRLRRIRMTLALGYKKEYFYWDFVIWHRLIAVTLMYSMFKTGIVSEKKNYQIFLEF